MSSGPPNVEARPVSLEQILVAAAGWRWRLAVDVACPGQHIGDGVTHILELSLVKIAVGMAVNETDFDQQRGHFGVV